MNDKHLYRPFASSAISWLTVVLGLLAIGTFLAISNPQTRYITPMAVSVGQATMGSSGGYGGAVPPSMPPQAAMHGDTVSNTSAQGSAPAYYPGYPYPYYNPDVPVTDTREFLKVNYNASMRSRDVQGLTRRVETTVRGYSGRIDQESSSPQYGSISFAIPMSKYDAFRNDIEALVGSRFLTVNISSQNLLPQKQSIEQQQAQADSNLSDLKTQRAQTVTDHSNKVKSLQSQLDANTVAQAALRAEVTNDAGRQAAIASQLAQLATQATALKTSLDGQNSNYANSIASLDSNIKYATDVQKAVQTQDQTLLDNVATVSGTISIQWISLWDTALLYLPGYWIPAIFAALAFLSYLNDRRRFVSA